jgi:hypothetical protein
MIHVSKNLAVELMVVMELNWSMVVRRCGRCFGDRHAPAQFHDEKAADGRVR